MGIYDRDYMRWDQGGGYSGGGGGSARPQWSATMVLLGINVAVFFLWWMARNAPGLAALMENHFVVGRDRLWRFHMWTLFTSAFSHFEPRHLIGNMLPLFFFGRELEYLYGRYEFLTFYLLGALASGLAHVAISPAPALGASGSVMGIVVLYAFLYPNREILLHFFIPVKIKYVAVLWVAMDLFGALGPGDGVAHAAHLGGAVTGLFYFKLNLRPYRFLSNLFGRKRWR